MFKAREFEEIINDSRKREKRIEIDISLPEDILRIYKTVDTVEISGDFKFLSYEKAKRLNKILHHEFPELDSQFWVFAENGQGDFWLIGLKDMPAISRVYFYDHDIEDYKSENILDIGITLEQWFVLGDLISQSEHDDYYDDSFTLKAPFLNNLRLEMEKISAGLYEVYPFSL